MMHTLQTLQRNTANTLICELHNRTIEFACTNKECQQQRHGCFKCIQDRHNKHIQEVQEFEGIKEGIDKCLQETDAIILKIDTFVKKAFQGLIKIKEQLLESKKQFSKFPGELTKTEIDLVIDEVVHYSQGRYQKIMEKVTKFINQLKITTDQGQSILIEDDQNIDNQNNDDSLIVDDVVQFQINLNIETKINQLNDLIAENNFTESLSLADEILNLNPDNENVQVTKAKLYYKSGQFNKAIQIYEQMLEKNPQNQIVKALLGQIYMDQCNYAKAEIIYEELYKLDPKDTDFAFKHGIIYVEIGRCLQQKQKYAEAYTIFLQIDNDNAPSPQVKFAIGDSLLRMGQLAQALSYWNEAIIYEHPEKEKIQQFVDEYSKRL